MRCKMRCKTMDIAVVLLLVTFIAHAQTIRLGAGVKGIHVMYEEFGRTGFIFWEGEPLMVGVSLSNPEHPDSHPIPLIWNGKRWHAFLRFELEKIEVREGNQRGTIPILLPQAVRFRVTKDFAVPKVDWGKPRIPTLSPIVLNPGEGARVEVELLLHLDAGMYRGRAILDGWQTPIGRQLISSWFFLEVRAVKGMRDQLAALAHRGYRMLFVGDLNKAEQAFKQMLALYPESVGGYYGLGKVYFEGGKYNEAEHMFVKARELFLQKRDQHIVPSYYEDHQILTRLIRHIERCHEARAKQK